MEYEEKEEGYKKKNIFKDAKLDIKKNEYVHHPPKKADFETLTHKKIIYKD